MKALATKVPPLSLTPPQAALPQLKAFLSELRGLTTAASTVPLLSPVRRRMTQASKGLAECIKSLERRPRGPSSRLSLKAG
jgi:hypothetical protein